MIGSIFSIAFALIKNSVDTPRLRTHNQNITVAARAMADRNTFGHRSYRVATRLQSFKRPNMISGLVLLFRPVCSQLKMDQDFI